MKICQLYTTLIIPFCNSENFYIFRIPQEGKVRDRLWSKQRDEQVTNQPPKKQNKAKQKINLKWNRNGCFKGNNESVDHKENR